MPAVAQVTLRPAARQTQAVPKWAARAAVARPTPRPTAPVLRAQALNMFVRRAALPVPLQQVPAEATHRAEAITEATAPAAPTTEAARLRGVPLQAQAVAQAAATTAEAVARVQAEATAQVEAAAVQAVEATAQVAEAVRVAVEEDKFQPKPLI